MSAARVRLDKKPTAIPLLDAILPVTVRCHVFARVMAAWQQLKRAVE